ncbi:hypothetical protein [Methylocystis sp. ATCC 49242]|uniref:hypothetical protein n=1 Tax=Methylocystis sp. ATCC 49242 TaxID=622637 RepID=UPI0001F86D0C|nr:hypothetical protein [Methylocystis sp. ATCC 49242]
MRKVFAALAALVAGYASGAFVGAVLVEIFSGNRHDKSLEAVMTAAFVTGPLGAFTGLLAAIFWRGSNS